MGLTVSSDVNIKKLKLIKGVSEKKTLSSFLRGK